VSDAHVNAPYKHTMKNATKL